MFQKVKIIGRLGQDPEMRYTRTAEIVSIFPVAVNQVRRKKDAQSNQYEQQTIWFSVYAFSYLAEIARQRLKRGDLVVISGRLVSDKNGAPRVYKSNDGSMRARFEIVAEELSVLRKQENEQLPSEKEGENIKKAPNKPIPTSKAPPTSAHFTHKDDTLHNNPKVSMSYDKIGEEEITYDEEGDDRYYNWEENEIGPGMHHRSF